MDRLKTQAEVLWDLDVIQREEPLDIMLSLQRILKVAADFLDVSRISIWLYRNNLESMQRLSLFDRNNGPSSHDLNLSAVDYPLYFKSCIDEQYLRVESITGDDQFPEFQKGYFLDQEIKSLLNVSLYLGNRLKGLVSIENTLDTHQWSDVELFFVRAIANRINLALADEERAESLSFDEGLEEANRTILLVSPWGGIKKVNSNTEALFGYSRNELLGMNVNQIIPGLMEKKELTRKLFNNQRDLTESGDNVKVTGINQFGEEIFLELSVSQISQWDGEQGLILLSDVSKDFSLIRKLEEGEALYRSLVEDQIDAIVRIIPGGKVVLVNQGFCSLFGITKEEAVKKTAYDFVPEQERHIFLNAAAKITVDKPVARYSHSVIVSGNVKKTFSWVSRGIFDEDDRLLSYQVIGRDITQETLRTEKLRQSQRLESLAILAGGMAHDFNNLLTPILTFTDMALTSLPQNSIECDDLKHVIEAANKAKELTRMVLVFSRQEESAERKPLHIGPFVQEILSFIETIIPTRVKLHQQVDSDCGVLNANPSDVYQILTNLCTNAFQAMPAGGDIFVSCVLVMKEGQQTLQLEIKDTGEGIHPDRLPHLFEPFYTTRSNAQGTGLGLAVVKGLVEELGGEIDCQSKLNHGSSFVIYLPVMDVSVKDREIDNNASLILGQELILIVDDDQNVGAIIKKGLVKLGYSVLVRSSADEALALLQEFQHSIDLVVTDFTMPYMTGLELSAKINSIQPDLPVVIMSGYGRLLSQEELKVNGVTHSIQKPFITEDLAIVIRNILNKKEA